MQNNWSCRSHSFIYRIVILLILTPLIYQTDAIGQKRVEWVYSEYVEFDQMVYGKVRRAIGSVHFRHEGTNLFCDSAYFYEESNKIEAYSNVHIQDSDTLNLFCDFLVYTPGNKMAIAQRNVVLVDPQVSLTTDELTYDLENEIAFYDKGGTIVSESNTLTSTKGWYYTQRKLFIFETDVILEHQKFNMFTDTLHYITTTEVANIFGPTLIESDENVIYAERGIYDTKKDLAWFWQNAWLKNNETHLAADSLVYDRNISFARAFRNVIITDSVNDYLLGGQIGEYDEITGYSFLTDSAWALFIDAGDSLSLHADTLYITFDTLQQGKVFTGYFQVKFYRSDIQGACDSITYLFADSTIIMYYEPVLWYEKTQIVADTIFILFRDKKINEMLMEGNAFIISEDIGDQYNQIKGRRISAYFEDDELRKMFVFGNTETLYYVRDDYDELIGIDKAVSDRLRIEFRDGEVEFIVYISKPSGSTYPEDELTGEERILRGFRLRYNERPVDRQDIFRWE